MGLDRPFFRKPGAEKGTIGIVDKAVVFFSTGGLIGFAPVAPGTAGSLAALPLCFLLSLLPVAKGMLALAALVAVSIWLAGAAARIELKKDPKQVVIDEFCGMAAALFGLPFTPGIVIAGVALFRCFDILKPFPIGWIDRRVPGGWGIVLDDVMAGVIANGVLRLALIVF